MEVGLEAEGLEMNAGETGVMFGCGVGDGVEERAVVCVCVGGGLAVVQFCATVAGDGFTGNVEWGSVVQAGS